MTIRRRSADSFTIVIELGTDSATGKRLQGNHTFRGNKKEAEKEERRLLLARDNGTYVLPSALTVEAFVEQWIKDHAAADHITARTAQGYSDMLRLHIAPAFRGILLQRLRSHHIQAFYSEMLESGRLPKAKKIEKPKRAKPEQAAEEPAAEQEQAKPQGLAPQTVRHLHNLLHEALRSAVMMNLLAVNPADAVTPPRVRREEVRILDKEQTLALLQAARGTRLYLPILLAIATGARRGEILALRWQDVDLQAGAVTIRRSLSETRKLGLSFKEPKSKKSVRSIALPAFAVAALKEHKKSQAEQKMLIRATYQENDLVLPRWDGRPWAPNLLTGLFGDFMKKQQLPRIRFHDLRHGSISMLLMEGVPFKVVSARAGHSTVGITLDTYGHLLPGADEQAAVRLESLIGAGLPAAADK
jgi:integrase